ncbi:hypothetical protein J3Q07_16585 [Pseudomonas sp. D4-18]|uniref:hypothetical protein n=1 Tax=Pseudomonas sp. D4-18 TaxID=2817395 RepID=UPI003DA96976
MSGEYWVICLEEILGDHGVEATSEQIQAIAEDVQSCAGVQGEYSAPVEHPAQREAEDLRKQLKIERSKVFCTACQGTGRMIERVGSGHSSNSGCWKCNGQGSIGGSV